MVIKRVLLIDDDRVSNFLNAITLRDHNSDCHVAEAIDGQQALDYLARQDECPDIIFLDINMMGMDGLEFLHKMERLDKRYDNLKIFILSSSAREEDKSMAFTSPLVKGYLDKPLSRLHIEEILLQLT